MGTVIKVNVTTGEQTTREMRPDEIPAPPPASEIAQAIRATRNTRIAACDWTQLPDAPLTSEQKAAWQAYRQALRDVTAQPGFPTDVQWPVAP